MREKLEAMKATLARMGNGVNNEMHDLLEEMVAEIEAAHDRINILLTEKKQDGL